MELAPITLFTYNRLRHTHKTIAALQKNDFAAESEIFIYSDGPRSAADEPKIQKVREYLRNITGFRNVTVIERKINLGLTQSIITGVTEIVNKYGRIIVLEDDIVTSPYFLRYMNEALEFYQDEERVISIHGYVYPVREKMPETFFLKGADCWGWATWKRGWDLLEPDGQKLLDELKTRNLVRRFDFDNTYPYKKMLEDQVRGKNKSWAIRWYASAFLKDKLTLYPGRSLVFNAGIDASGTHCVATNAFSTELSCEPIKVGNIPLQEDPNARDAFKAYFYAMELPLVDMISDWVKRMVGRKL